MGFPTYVYDSKQICIYTYWEWVYNCIYIWILDLKTKIYIHFPQISLFENHESLGTFVDQKIENLREIHEIK